jgi:hypothetical protein
MSPLYVSLLMPTSVVIWWRSTPCNFKMQISWGLMWRCTFSTTEWSQGLGVGSLWILQVHSKQKASHTAPRDGVLTILPHRISPTNPMMFCVGDIVEANLSIVIMPVKQNKFQCYGHLHSWTAVKRQWDSQFCISPVSTNVHISLCTPNASQGCHCLLISGCWLWPWRGRRAMMRTKKGMYNRPERVLGTCLCDVVCIL